MVKRSKKFYGWDQLPVMMTTEEASCVLRVTEVTVRTMIREGRLPGVKIGKSWRIDREMLRRFAEGGAAIGAAS